MIFAIIQLITYERKITVKEFCAEHIQDIEIAIKRNIDRIELCSHLELGGLTPKQDIFDHVYTLCQKKGIKLMVMIREQANSFYYDEMMIHTMVQRIQWFKSHGADGVVFGCLTKKNTLDIKAIQRLVQAAEGMDMTFHMAFDELSRNEQLKAIPLLADVGIHRILTHGGPMNEPIETHIDHLRQLISVAQQYHVTIMPGGGITNKNIATLSQVLNTNEWHGTKIVGDCHD